MFVTGVAEMKEYAQKLVADAIVAASSDDRTDSAAAAGKRIVAAAFIHSQRNGTSGAWRRPSAATTPLPTP